MPSNAARYSTLSRPRGPTPPTPNPRRLHPTLAVGIGLDQAGVDRKAFAGDEPFCDATAHHRLEHLPQNVALAEAAMTVLGEGRMIGTSPRQTEAGRTIDRPGSGGPPRTAAAPTGCQSNSRRSASGSAVPDRPRAACRTVERRQVRPYAIEIDEPVNRPKHVVAGTCSPARTRRKALLERFAAHPSSSSLRLRRPE